MLRMKKVLKGIIRGLDHIVNFIALSLILAAMFLSGYMLWDSHQVYQTADAKNYEAYIPTEKSTKSFEELQKINPDVIGWIRVNDTNINYPLVQTDNDDTYMNTDAEGKRKKSQKYRRQKTWSKKKILQKLKNLKQKYQRSLQSRLLTMKNLQNRQVMSSFQIRYLYRV